jgi:hypothetical protein
MPIDSVAVLPWLSLREAVAVGEVTFYPAECANDVLGDRGEVLADRLRIYRDTWDARPVHASFAVHQSQIENGGHAPVPAIRTATDIFLTASMFQNDGGLGNEVNATTFTLFFQGLGGEVGFMATRIRRRYGGLVVGSTTDLQQVQPAYAAPLRDYSREMIDALLSAKSHSDVWNLFKALEWFRRASTEADNIDYEVDLVLLLTSIDFLLAHPGSRRHGGLDQERIRALLSRFDLRPCCSVRTSQVERSQIQTFLFILDRVRNETLHPGADQEKAEYYGFGRSPVAFAWFADRCLMALLVGRLIELGVLTESLDLRAFVAAVEKWLFEPKDSLGKMTLDVKLKQAARSFVLEQRRWAAEEIGVVTDIDTWRQQWQQDFYIALEPVGDPFQVELHWLADGTGRITIHRRSADGLEFLDDMSFNPTTDEATRIAWAVKAYFARNSVTESHDLTDADLQAMQDPRMFLGGARSS